VPKTSDLSWALPSQKVVVLCHLKECFFFVSFVFYIICRSIGFFAFANLIFVCGYSFINTRQTANVWHEIGMRFKKLLRFGPRKLMTKMSLSLQSFVLLLLLSVPNHLTFY